MFQRSILALVCVLSASAGDFANAQSFPIKPVPIGSTSEELAAYTKAEISRWALAVKLSAASAD